MSDGPASYWRDKSVTLSGASQAVFTDVGYNGVQERFISNPSATNNLWINPFGNPAVVNGKGSFLLAPGGYWACQTCSAINVLGVAADFATAGER